MILEHGKKYRIKTWSELQKDGWKPKAKGNRVIVNPSYPDQIIYKPMVHLHAGKVVTIKPYGNEDENWAAVEENSYFWPVSVFDIDEPMSDCLEHIGGTNSYRRENNL